MFPVTGSHFSMFFSVANPTLVLGWLWQLV